jgi:hypothetical protein
MKKENALIILLLLLNAVYLQDNLEYQPRYNPIDLCNPIILS